VTVSLTLAAAVISLLVCHTFGYSWEKTFLILEIVVLKLVESFLEVYVCRHQQMGRLDVGSKVYASELIASTAVICILLLCRCNLFVSILAGIVVALLVSVLCIRWTVSLTDSVVRRADRKKVVQLLKTGGSLCVGQTLYMYIGNAPKYLIDLYMDERSQALFGFVMMPMFVITLLNNFLLQPIVRKLGEVWEAKQLAAFRKMVRRQYLIVAGLTVFVLLLGIFAGLPILSLVYGVDLNVYRMEFAVLMVGAMFYTISYYLTVVLTTVRRQNLIVLGYGAAVLLYVCLGHIFITSWGLLGASYLYLLANAVTAVLFTAFTLHRLRHQES
jgi:O-antigen/teichoic acid export membrane protein